MHQGPELTWVHISDIHVTTSWGSSAEQALVLQELVRDLRLREEFGAPDPDVVFLTGDIAATGGGKGGLEYVRAGQYVDGIVEAAGVDPAHVFIVAGNHDVRRATTAWSRTLIAELHAGTKDIDTVTATEQRALRRRLEGFSAFSEQYMGQGDGAARYGPSWFVRPLPSSGDIPVHVLGLNTALLCQHDGEQGQLQVGANALHEALSSLPEDALAFGLMHHPLDWVRPEEAGVLRSRLDRFCDVVLHGHLHRARASYGASGRKELPVRLEAGATYAPSARGKPWLRDGGHSYSIGALYPPDRSGRRYVVVWPRLFSPADHVFDVDRTYAAPNRSHTIRLFLPRRGPARPVRLNRGDAEEDPDTHDQTRYNIDWPSASQPVELIGRTRDIDEVEGWITSERCRLVAIVGIGGIGKTSLVAALADRMSGEFDYIFGRSIENRPPLHSVLPRCILFLTDQAQAELPRAIDDQIELLLELLRSKRCLIVIDNLESVLQSGERAGDFENTAAAYLTLLQRVAATPHQSCVVLTSREKPRFLNAMEGRRAHVRTKKLSGLDALATRRLLRGLSLTGSDSEYHAITEAYSGNPLSLHIIGPVIAEAYAGRIGAFLRDGQFLVGDVYDLIAEQFARLPGAEQELMYWLALERDTLTAADLRRRISRNPQSLQVAQNIASLRSRSLVDQRGTAFFLQPAVADFALGDFMARAVADVQSAGLTVLATHAVMKARAGEDLRLDQYRVVLAELALRLETKFRATELEERLSTMLSHLRASHPSSGEYGAGNLMNLMLALKIDLRARDFSGLRIREAYLAGADMRDSSLAGSDVAATVFADNFDVVLTVAYDPTGELLAAGTANGVVRLWDASTTERRGAFHGHTARVRSVAFSPDGALIASASDDSSVRVWDVLRGTGVAALVRHEGRVRTVAFSPDGLYLASAGQDHTLRLWSVATWALAAEVRGREAQIRSVCFSPDGSSIVLADDAGCVSIREVPSGEEVRTLQAHTHQALCVAVAPNGSLVASGGTDKAVRVWEVATGKLLWSATRHTRAVRSISFDPTGGVVATASEDQTVRLWDVGSGEPVATLLGHTNRAYGVAFSADGTLVASGSEDHTIRIWDVTTRRSVAAILGHTNWVWAVAFTQDGRHVVSASDDRIVRILDAATLRETNELRGHGNRVRAVAVHPSNNRLATCSDDETIRLWSSPAGAPLITLRGHTGRVRCVAFSADGALLASGSDDQTIRLWSPATGEPLKILSGHKAWVRAVSFAADGQRVISGAEDGTVKVWDVGGTSDAATWRAHPHRTQAVDSSPTDDECATVGDDDAIRVWNVSDGALRRELRSGVSSMRTVRYSPDGTRVCSGGDDGVVRVWNLESEEMILVLPGHTRRIFCVAFSPDGRSLASAGEDGRVTVWDLAGHAHHSIVLDRQYERMSIAGTTGLSDGQVSALLALGALRASS